MNKSNAAQLLSFLALSVLVAVAISLTGSGRVLPLAMADEPVVRDHRGMRPAAPVSAAAYDVTKCPVCSGVDWLAAWQEAMPPNSFSLGVVGKDAVGYRIGNFVPKSQWDGYKNWFPNSDQKTTVCGHVEKFNVFDSIGDEWDWNIFLRPSPHYAFAIRDVMKRLDPSGTGYKQVADGQGGSYQLYIFRDWHVGPANAALCSQGHVCDNKQRPFLLEAEVSPDEKFYVNPWFWKDYERDASGRIITKPGPDGLPIAVKKSGSSLVGKTICTYGAWVREQNHGFRPEIHPSELLWWREDLGARSLYYLMQVQDDSNRFDLPLNFEGAYQCTQKDLDGIYCVAGVIRPEIRTWFRPWAEPPRIGQFKIGFEVDLNSSTTQQYTITEPAPVLGADRFPDPNHQQVAIFSVDQTPGTDHAVTFNVTNRVGAVLQKKTVLQVFERVRFPNLLGVRFSQICRDPATNKLKGFIEITSAIGKGSRGTEGYQVLRVERQVLNSPSTGTIVTRAVEAETPIVEESSTVSARGKLVPGSLRRVEIDGRTQLAGDIEVAPKMSVGERADLAIAKVELIDGDQRTPKTAQPVPPRLGVTARGLNSTAVVEAVALTPASGLELTLQSGEKVDVPLSSTLSVTPRLLATPLPRSKSDVAVWKAWAAATGAPPTSRPPSKVSVLRPTEWRMALTPYYAPTRDGLPSLEDDSPVGEQINEAIREHDPRRLTQVFGSTQPFTIKWSFAATNLVTQQPVAVKTTDPTDPAAVRVQMPDAAVPSSALQITFPTEPSSGLYELQVTATITDTLGHSGQSTEEIWSHVLGSPSSVQLSVQLLQLIGTLSGLSSRDIAMSVASPRPTNTTGTNPHIRQLHTLRLFAEQAAEDQVISIEEFSGLLGMAKHIKAAG